MLTADFVNGTSVRRVCGHVGVRACVRTRVCAVASSAPRRIDRRVESVRDRDAVVRCAPIRLPPARLQLAVDGLEASEVSTGTAA